MKKTYLKPEIERILLKKNMDIITGSDNSGLTDENGNMENINKSGLDGLDGLI